MKKEHLAKLGSVPTRPPGRLPKLADSAKHGTTALTSTRQATHRGHTIEVRTTYTITVDGQPLKSHVEVDDLGRVHYHGLPNYNFPSAIDMVKSIIDADPASFRSVRGGKAGHPEGPGHGGGH